MRRNALLITTILFASTAFARADLVSMFHGYESVWGVGVSGQTSSYYSDVKAGATLDGATTGGSLPVFGPDRISYPSGIGQVPSPGGAVGMEYDQGVIGVRASGDDVYVRLATRLDPMHGVYNKAWKTWYGQGDVFMAVEDSAGLSHFALLNYWPVDDAGKPRNINRNYFKSAEAFHVSGGPDGGSLEGQLVALGSNSDVTRVGGRGAYTGNKIPTGLDTRAYAQGGAVLGDAGLSLSMITEDDATWYIETWAFDAGQLSDDPTFDLALHTSATCGNDQIGGRFPVPEPNSLLLMVAGVLAACRLRR